MRFGLSLSMQHPMGDDLGQRFAELLETVRLARQAGFHHVSASQHYLAAPFQYISETVPRSSSRHVGSSR